MSWCSSDRSGTSRGPTWRRRTPGQPRVIPAGDTTSPPISHSHSPHAIASRLLAHHDLCARRERARQPCARCHSDTATEPPGPLHGVQALSAGVVDPRTRRSGGSGGNGGRAFPAIPSCTATNWSRLSIARIAVGQGAQGRDAAELLDTRPCWAESWSAVRTIANGQFSDRCRSVRRAGHSCPGAYDPSRAPQRARMSLRASRLRNRTCFSPRATGRLRRSPHRISHTRLDTLYSAAAPCGHVRLGDIHADYAS